MKWIVRILAVIGVYYGSLMLAGAVGIGHAFFYYGAKPVQVIIDKEGNKFFVVGAPSYNEFESNPTPEKETTK